MVQLTNWAGNLEYTAARVLEPESLDQLQEIVRKGRSLRVLGSRHSFNDIADSRGDLVSLARIPRRIEIDARRSTVTLDGGVRYGELCRLLDEAGFALHNLASLPHISVAGACATATHGSGDRNGNLATAVTAMEVVTSDGEIVALSRDDDSGAFEGAVVSLGGLGVVNRLTLEIQPAFQVRQDLYDDLPLAELEEHFDELTSAADSVSFFTDWQEPNVVQVWLKRLATDAEVFEPSLELFAATLATVPRHPIRGMPTDACTPQLGVVGPWYDRIPHFRIDHTPSSGAELQSEYFVGREHAVDGLRAIAAIGGRLAQLLQISEVRTIAADELWLSPAYRRDSVTFHFTWQPDWTGVRAVLPIIEAALRPFDARPHWGKVFTMSADELRSRYMRLPAFVELLERYDPNGKFRNDFMDRHIFGSPA